jgi:hypothetical protein
MCFLSINIKRLNKKTSPITSSLKLFVIIQIEIEFKNYKNTLWFAPQGLKNSNLLELT